MMKFISKNKCTGCSTCKNICPKNAITMEKDSEGFLFPKIDEKKCINCGLCKKICPVLNSETNESLNKCYVGYNNDKDIVKKSSSGGIFTLIANHVLEENGIVIGASFDKNNKLKHVAIENKKDLHKLMGSKYLQSDLNDMFTFIKNNIKERKILFVGTPCQVAGLKSFLKKDYDNLITVDLICHGVPSPKLFSKYVEYLENKNNDTLLNYNFRDKSTGWDTYSNKATFKNKEIKELSIDNYYMKLFLSDNALRYSCYNCNFKLGNKYSDITLGDFWGVKSYYEDMYNKDGVSAIIVNTEKGNTIFNNIKNKLKYKECKIEEIVNGNPCLKYSSKKGKNREKFFYDLDKMEFEKLYKKYRSKKKNIFIRILNKLKKVIKKILGIFKYEKSN